MNTELKYCIFIIFLFGMCDVYCQTKIGQDIHVDCKNELTSNNFWGRDAIQEDAMDRYWISTFNGLNIYDGYEIKQIYVEANDPHSIPNKQITASAKDNFGNMWFGTGNDGVFYYNAKKETFNKIDLANLKPDGTDILQVNDIEFDKSGRLWIMPPFKGIHIYDPKDSSLVKLDTGLDQSRWKNHYCIKNLSGDSMSIQVDDKFVVGSLDVGFKSYVNTYNHLHLNHQLTLSDSIILASQDFTGEIFLFNYLTGEYRYIDQVQGVDGLFLGYNDIVYFTGLEGAMAYDIKSDSIYHVSDNMHHLIDGVFDNRNNLLYMSGSQGMCRAELFNQNFDLIDSDGCGYVRKFGDNQFIYNQGNKFFIYDANSGERDLYFDFGDLGTYIFNYYVMDDLSIFVNIYNDDQTNLFNYLLTPERKVKMLNERARGYRFIRKTKDKLAVNTEVYLKSKIYEKLYFPGDSLTSIKEEKYPFFNISAVYERKNEEVWIAHFNNGAAVINKDGNEVLSFPEDMTDMPFLGSHIHDFYEMGNGDFYVFADQGINIYNRNGGYKFINSKQGMSEYEVHRVGEDSKGRMWAFTRSMLYCWDNKLDSLYKFRLSTPRQNFTNSEIELFSDQDGYIYFDDPKGFNRFHPDSLLSFRGEYQLIITDLYLDRNRIYPDDNSGVLDSSLFYQREFNLEYSQRDVGFSFVAVDGSLDDLQYYYKLDGYKDNWIPIDHQRTVHFTNLNEGDYTFKVKALQGNGMWLKNIASVKFYISPPWHRTYLAYGIFTFLCLTFAYGLFKYRLYQLTKYDLLRVKISSDLHDDVGTLLSSVAMQSEVLSLSADDDKKERFDNLSNLSREAMGRMRDTVWAIDSRRDNVDSLVDRMQDYLSDISLDSKLKVNFDHSKSKLTSSIAPDIRQNVYLIFKEAINNAFKYSSGDMIDIVLITQGKSLSLTIRDNGKVDDSKIKTSGMGLSNMKMRAKRIGGEIIFNHDNGFEVVLTIKK